MKVFDFELTPFTFEVLPYELHLDFWEVNLRTINFPKLRTIDFEGENFKKGERHVKNLLQ